MNCCQCNGQCNHIGAHTYCEAHGGKPQGRVWTTNNTWEVLISELAEQVRGLDRYRLYSGVLKEQRFGEYVSFNQVLAILFGEKI
jgi:hypothetical protein